MCTCCLPGADGLPHFPGRWPSISLQELMQKQWQLLCHTDSIMSPVQRLPGRSLLPTCSAMSSRLPWQQQGRGCPTATRSYSRCSQCWRMDGIHMGCNQMAWLHSCSARPLPICYLITHEPKHSSKTSCRKHHTILCWPLAQARTADGLTIGIAYTGPREHNGSPGLQ